MNKFMNDMIHKAVIGYGAYKCINIIRKHVDKVKMEVELTVTEEDKEKKPIDYKKVAAVAVGATVVYSEVSRRARIKRIEKKVDDIKEILYMFM